MGLFSGVKDNWKKAEAAVVVQNLLETFQQLNHSCKLPAEHANDMVGECWDQYRDAFSGKFGQRPHKLTVAFTAAMLRLSKVGPNASESSIVTRIAQEMRNEILRNGMLYKFNSLDQKFLDVAIDLAPLEIE